MHGRVVDGLLTTSVLIVMTVGLSFLLLTDLGDYRNYNTDEGLWVTVSNKLFRLYFIEHDFDHTAWHEEYSTFGSRQPQIGKYIIGLGTSFVDFNDEPERYRWIYRQSAAWNMEHTVPPADLVTSGRIPVALMGVVTGLTFYWLVTLVTNRLVGIFALASLIGAGLLISSSRQAMIDTPALAFSMMTLIGMVHVLRAIRSERTLQAVILALPTGLAAGLAVGTKLNAILILLVCVAALLLEALLAGRRSVGASILALGVLVGAVSLVVYGSNPFLYRQPLAGVAHLLELSSLVAAIPLDQLLTVPERIAAVWASMELYAPLHVLGVPGDRWLVLLGVVALSAKTYQGLRGLRELQLDLIILWICITYVGVTLWIPHNWSRYYLPLQTCNAFLHAYGIYWLGETSWRHLELSARFARLRSDA